MANKSAWKRQGQPKPFGRRAGRRDRHRENCQTSLFPRRGTRRPPRPAGDPLYEAVLGTKVSAPPTLEGTVEPRFHPARMADAPCACAAKACLRPNGSSGDPLVSLKIVLPDEADSELINLMRKWESQRSYNPRTGLVLLDVCLRPAHQAPRGRTMRCLSGAINLRARAKKEYCLGRGINPEKQNGTRCTTLASRRAYSDYNSACLILALSANWRGNECTLLLVAITRGPDPLPAPIRASGLKSVDHATYNKTGRHTESRHR